MNFSNHGSSYGASKAGRGTFNSNRRGGSGRGRGRGGYRSRGGGDVKVDKTREFLEREPSGASIKTIGLPEVSSEHQGDGENLTITRCEYLTSYNWLDKSEPTVLIPGR